MRNQLIFLSFIILILSNLLSGASAQDGQLVETKALNGQAVQLYNAGRYAEAEALYKKALEIPEKKLGSDHPSVAIVQEMAGLYRKMGRNKEVEVLEKQAARVRAMRQ